MGEPEFFYIGIFCNMGGFGKQAVTCLNCTGELFIIAEHSLVYEQVGIFGMVNDVFSGTAVGAVGYFYSLSCISEYHALLVFNAIVYNSFISLKLSPYFHGDIIFFSLFGIEFADSFKFEIISCTYNAVFDGEWCYFYIIVFKI